MNKLQQTISLVKEQDKWRGSECLNLIASENKLSPLAQSLYSSDFIGRYAEGEPYKRHYQGTKIIDQLESRAIELTKQLFNADQVELRPISGAEANRIVLAAYCKPGDTIMSYATPSGGHFTHNSGARRYGFQTYSFPLTDDYFHIDIKKTKEELRRIKPKLLILGKSLFLFQEPIKELKELFDGPIVYDAAHVLGLIAGNKFQNPLEEGASVVTASTHKTFFGPQGGLIYARNLKEFERIKKSVVETVSNHHLMRIPPYLIACLEFMETGREYASQIIRNAQTLAKALHKKGLDVKCAEFGFTET
ncbi:MAG: aminotransferase class I/II-fold pyridoxal phosphate-dependent enzyme, partial [Candidatus Aenigmarchaeota archaeon]|nr:aminotransferase class I/II-fold pyridoxal phosphate-dependent enzyme [Candidatus Aenigmarchaeota archaeon]